MSAIVHQRAPRRPPAPARQARPTLKVVDQRHRSPAARRARLLAWLMLGVVAAALFGLVASHVALTQGQFRLDALRKEAAAQQDRYERLRLQVAELESPGRVVAAAQERLGMVAPPGVTYLSPVGPASGTADDEATDAAAKTWSTVKPQLASRP